MDPSLLVFVVTVLALGLALAFTLYARAVGRRFEALERRDREHQRTQTRHAALHVQHTLAIDAADRRVSDVGAELDSQRRPAIRPGPPKGTR